MRPPYAQRSHIHRIQSRVNYETLEKIRKLARDNRAGMSHVVRLLVMKALESEDPKITDLSQIS